MSDNIDLKLEFFIFSFHLRIYFVGMHHVNASAQSIEEKTTLHACCPHCIRHTFISKFNSRRHDASEIKALIKVRELKGTLGHSFTRTYSAHSQDI